MKKKAKKVYSFSVPRLYGSLTAEKAAKELERIKSKYGELKPEYVVKESEDNSSVLHGVFEWDDNEAANGFRVVQAQKLINNIRVEVVYNEVKCNIKAFVNVREQKCTFRSYVPVEEAMKNDFAYKDLLEQSKREMNDFIEKYSQLSELNKVRAEMVMAINKMDKK